MQATNLKTASLQQQLQSLDATMQSSGNIAIAIMNAQDLLQETKTLAKTLNNNMLADFLNANCVILKQLQQITQTSDASNTLITKSNDIMQQLAIMYQETMVPMLTRLHNLCDTTEDMQKITAITTLGNEIITCNGQINQFSDKLLIMEKICTIFAVVLMLSSISMMIAILSKPNISIAPETPIIVMACGFDLCKKAMQQHVSDPGTDLISTSIKKMEPLLNEIAKDFAIAGTETQAAPKVTATKPQTVKKPAVKSEPIQKPILESEIASEPGPEPKPRIKPQPVIAPQAEEPKEAEAKQGNLFGMIKEVFDLFSTKK
ncbi:MAG TPA: hypothetical protein VLG38_01220 [Gammaproteobacteria bacterium]|nr:hypothetical protein [Gammaproteobacteria bacterium]